MSKIYRGNEEDETTSWNNKISNDIMHSGLSNDRRRRFSSEEDGQGRKYFTTHWGTTEESDRMGRTDSNLRTQRKVRNLLLI